MGAVLTSAAASLAVLAAVQRGLCAAYSRSSSLAGKSFLDAFSWQTNADPNYGRVNYVDRATAQSKGLVSIFGNQVTLRADSTAVLNSTGPGRDSFNLVSKDQYAVHVAIFDIAHVPEGCGTWPAVFLYYWPQQSRGVSNEFSRELGSNWPYGGELDIVEGINDQSPDLVTLHTSANCTMPSHRAMTGTSRGTNCDVYETGGSSCGVSVNDTKSFGPPFNSAGGGWYALERTSSFIQVFFWERRSASVPKDVRSPGPTIDTDDWGTPAAYFPSSIDCDFATHLSPFSIVIDLDFCGSWAGNAQLYASSGCPSTCVDHVNRDPSAFRGAYFTFNALDIYE